MIILVTGLSPPLSYYRSGRYSPENILHGGEWDGFSGFNWGGGGAATAAAYLELRFGGALVSVAGGVASGVGIDGVRVAGPPEHAVHEDRI